MNRAHELFPPPALDVDFSEPAPPPGPNGVHPSRGIFDYPLVLDGDDSVLLGNRYLNRGDGAILVSQSGMGKSAMCLQMATELALGRSPFGILNSTPRRSLIIQAEDSDGDVAEVAHSISHVLQLSPEQRAQVNERVRVETDRTSRGLTFMTRLRALIAQHRPDFVWVNPLQAFIDGDITQAKELGFFLRSQLNSLHTAVSTFAFILVHHTTKPPNAKDRQDRQWHEVMYDMAGGAELINWARAVLSLRPTATEGEFRLVLAKRGRRAGVTKPTESGAQSEPTTEIFLRYAKDRLIIPGIARGLPTIFWHTQAEPPKAAPEKRHGGRPEKYPFEQYRSVFPAHDSPGLPFAQLNRALDVNGPIAKGTLSGVLARWAEDGFIEKIEAQNRATLFRRAF